MARWKTLPPQLGERDRQLVAQLRRLKDHSGLSLAALETRTSSSRSSWERYLNGRTPPSREAVGELARVCGSDPTRLLVLYDVAARDRGARAEENGQDRARQHPDEEPEPARTSHGRTPRPAVLASAGCALLVAFAAGYAVASATGAGTTPQDPAAYAYQEDRTYSCGTGRKDGGRYAGHGVTRETLLTPDASGRDVVEAQCLLRAHGVDPGVVDGLYGPAVTDAVRAFQKRRGLVPDGLVGENTWRELRR
ncbi:peptidoglycan-binding protein [Streptomyces sp. NBC_00237]|uniref:peptidoglycan-binding protein n=1 Tax=Streptomyces sp. NBC_00237 TaxID=2975687 RepID=UPI00225B2D78|nr:peptidoglycan-binding protein [Streptomyces sp. NBC_00237]MCX5204712.1 peptidoglycan-binding protein [Streptomyces sp. NBC_00237]